MSALMRWAGRRMDKNIGAVFDEDGVKVFAKNSTLQRVVEFVIPPSNDSAVLFNPRRGFSLRHKSSNLGRFTKKTLGAKHNDKYIARGRGLTFEVFGPSNMHQLPEAEKPRFKLKFIRSGNHAAKNRRQEDSTLRRRRIDVDEARCLDEHKNTFVGLTTKTVGGVKFRYARLK
ncbi:hypothetical protein BDR05DRAFT_950356 [Suillus weaverae]|nr:hypothetical protein BDR05DRAFT_950356 [Suillus weaverae]